MRRALLLLALACAMLSASYCGDGVFDGGNEQCDSGMRCVSLDYTLPWAGVGPSLGGSSHFFGDEGESLSQTFPWEPGGLLLSSKWRWMFPVCGMAIEGLQRLGRMMGIGDGPRFSHAPVY